MSRAVVYLIQSVVGSRMYNVFGLSECLKREPGSISDKMHMRVCKGKSHLNPKRGPFDHDPTGRYSDLGLCAFLRVCWLTDFNGTVFNYHGFRTLPGKRARLDLIPRRCFWE
jgi:hypothetical protein